MIRIIKIDREQWDHMSEEAHRAAFGSERTFLMQRADYALLALDRDNSSIGYISVSEQDRDTVHWTYGGVFSDYKSSLKSFRAFQAAIEWTSVFHKSIWCSVESDRPPMIRALSKLGFKICGVRNFQNTLLVEHILRLR